MGRFGIGQPVLRSEDVRFLTGAGRYTADISLPTQAHAVILRSPYAHARLVGIDAAAAAAVPGVLAVITADDLARDGLGDIACAVPVAGPLGQPMPRPGRPLLARGRVRFVGEPVALVVAETLLAARDGAEAIEVAYEPLPALATVEDAVAEGAPVRIWDGAPGNIAFVWRRGDEAKVAAALQAAPRVVRIDLVNNRVVPCPMEPRAALGSWDPATGRYTLHTSSQGAHGVRDQLAEETLRVPADRIHVIVPDVGGGFGTKIFHYPEEALVLWAARRLERPVKWVGDRAEAFVGDTHGRDQRNRVAAAFDADGRIRALRVDTLANMGAYLNQYAPAIPSQATGAMLSGSYTVPAVFATCRGVYTNTVPVDAYRGAGRPEASYLLERLMDAAARQFGLGQDEIRRRNFIQPEQMPYRTACGPVYDSGDFARNLDDALAAADWAGFAERQERSRARGLLRGRGLSCYVEVCGFDDEEATIRCGADGTVELTVGTQSTGQGHETAYAQIVVDTLGVPFERVRVMQGDTDRIPFGRGTSGSRTLMVGGSAVRAACETLRDTGERLARHLLQAGDGPLHFEAGRFAVPGRDGDIGFAEIAAALSASGTLPPEGLPPEIVPGGDLPPEKRRPELAATGRYALEAPTFPNGTHVCEVEVDPDTGFVQVVRYHVADDFGTVINPMLLAGQVYGGIAQGIGQALFEHAIYDRESAQLVTGSFIDYGLPRAADLPRVDFRTNVVPCTTNPLGVKGAGEAGTIGACPAVVNAVLDALAPLGVHHVDMPLTPETIWRAIAGAASANATAAPPTSTAQE